MYTRLMRSHIHADLAIPHLLEVENYLNNYFAMYKRLMYIRIHVKLVSPTYMGLRII